MKRKSFSGTVATIVLIFMCALLVHPRPAAAVLINHPPVADADGPYLGYLGMPVTFDGSGSYDPDVGDSIILFEWDFDADGTYDFSATDPAASHTYVTLGFFNVLLRVQDNFGLLDVDAAIVEIIEKPVSTPEPGTLALFGIGLVGLGFAARRRRRTG